LARAGRTEERTGTESLSVNVGVTVGATVPVAVSGGRHAMRKGSPLIWPVTVTVDLGAPVPTQGLAAEDREGLIERVRASIAARLPKVL